MAACAAFAMGNARAPLIQNGSSRLLISQVFLSRSVPNRQLQDGLRTKRFFRASVPNIALWPSKDQNAPACSARRRRRRSFDPTGGFRQLTLASQRSTSRRRPAEIAPMTMTQPTPLESDAAARRRERQRRYRQRTREAAMSAFAKSWRRE